jgi:hypothetical protein
MSEREPLDRPGRGLSQTLGLRTAVTSAILFACASHAAMRQEPTQATPTPSTEGDRVALEAKEVAGLQLKAPTIGNLARVSEFPRELCH